MSRRSSTTAPSEKDEGLSGSFSASFNLRLRPASIGKILGSLVVAVSTILVIIEHFWPGS